MSNLKILKRIWQALPLSDYIRWKLTTLVLEARTSPHQRQRST